MNTINKTVDFHAHPVDEVFRREIENLGIDVIAEDGFPLPEWSVKSQLDFMSEAGIDFSVLTVPAPHIHNGDDEKACAAARKINESTAKICAENPDKFAFAAVLPLPCVDGAIKETAYAMDTLGAVGVKVVTNSNGVYLGDPEPVAPDMLRAVADDDKIVFGSDFPHTPARVIIAKKRHFEGNQKYTNLIKKIYQENAA